MSNHESTLPPDGVDAFPTAEDRFFDAPGFRNTWASEWERAHDWYHYVNGYKDAADMLLENRRAAGRAAHRLGPPIVFLYRHHLELAVKQLLRECGTRLGRDVVLPMHHRLDELWRFCLSMLAEVSPGITAAEEVAQTTRLFDELCRVDPTSQAFRYPEDHQGNPSLSGVGEIELERIHDVVEKISLLLDCISTELSTLEG